MFGTAKSLPQAICIRLLQGIFAGAVGVARGCVAFITDPSNEGRAYAILGYDQWFSCFACAHDLFRFCWGMGGVAGAIIGGSCTFCHSRSTPNVKFYVQSKDLR